ncbi:MAG: hypothetical protein V1720_20700 [bacterium]
MKSTLKSVFILTILFVIQNQILFSQSISSQQELKTFLDEKEKIFEDISVQMGVANWNVYSAEGEADLDTPNKRYVDLFSDKSLNEAITDWYKKKDEIEDLVLQRRVEVWHHVLTSAKVDYNEEVFSLANKLEKWLAGSGDVANKPDNEQINKMVLDLFKIRNKKAKELGFDNYAYMALELSALNVDWFNKMINMIEERTREPYLKLIEDFKKEQNTDTLKFQAAMRWVGAFYMNSMGANIEKDAMTPVMKSTLSNIGIDYDKLPVRFVEKDIPYGGNGLAIQIPNDFRIVVQLNMPIAVWMHELGHGLHGMFTKIESPILKGYEWCLGNESPAFGEGMAQSFAFFANNPVWLKENVGATDESIKSTNDILDKYAPAYLRYQLTAILLEIEMYKNLDANPTQLRDKLNKKYLMLDVPQQNPVDLANVFYAAYPVYLQNYFIADIIAWQVHDALESKFGKDYIYDAKVSEHMINNLYKDGALYTWQQKMKNATGRELDIDGYLKSFGL